MSVDILYVAYNRLAMTEASIGALLTNTNWEHVDTLYIHDDGSSDGTAELLREIRAPAPVVFHGDKLGGPVAAMNWYLDQRSDADRFAKVDNDFIVCPGWLEEILRIMTVNAGVDIFGIEPMIGPAVPAFDPDRGLELARFIGGKGILRKRAFELCRPSPGGFNGYQGFTQFQMAHPQIVKGWVRPELPCFGLDQLCFEPWRSLTTEYEEKGWARRWPEYEPSMSAYWDWWLDEQAVE